MGRRRRRVARYTGSHSRSISHRRLLRLEPLEERRTQAVMTRRSLSQRDVDEIGALDPAAVLRVREEAWPAPE